MRATKNMKMNETISSTKKQDPVRVYIENYSLGNNGLLSKLELLDNYFMNSSTYTRILSSSGIFHIENNKMYKMNPIDRPVTTCKNYIGAIGLVLDKSIYEKEVIYSQIPYDHVTTNIVTFQYSIATASATATASKNKHGKKDPNLILVVEGTYQVDVLSNAKTNKYHHFVPTNMYFLAMEEINNYLMKEELVEFLSVLF